MLALALFSFQVQFAAAKTPTFTALAEAHDAMICDFLIIDEPRAAAGFSAETMSFVANVSCDGDETLVKASYSGGQIMAKGAEYKARLRFSFNPDGDRVQYRANLIGSPRGLTDANRTPFSIARGAFMSSLSAVTPEAKALVAGLAIGDKSLMPLALAKDMKTVSLTHLMAVSGANCAIVAGCVTLLLKRVRLSRNTRAICTSLAIAGYVALVGPEPSVIRSGFMAITVVVALSIGRKPVPIAALGFAVLCLLVVDPWLSVSFGFALSVAATAGILLLTPAVYDRLSRRLPKYLALSVAVSIAAQIFCLPILLQLQDGLSTYSLLANVIVEPLVAPITVLGILACTVAWFAPWLSSWFTALAGLGTWIIAESAHFFANLPMATLKWAGGVPAIILGVGIAMTSLTWFRLKAGWLRLASCLFLLVTVAATFVAQVPVQRLTSNWPPQDWQIVQCDVGQGDALILRSKGAVAVIDVGREDSPIDECLSNLSVDVIDLLVLTHFDMDHVGGLAGAIKGRLVRTTLVSPFVDPRWAATNSLHILETKGSKVSVVRDGATGQLGDVHFRVIGPAVTDSQIEDSNDGSLVMFWQFGQFNLVTMADAGERSQQNIANRSIDWLERVAKQLPLVLKVSHHGSADQFAEFIEALDPDVSLVSVGVDNAYGHPTQRTLQLLELAGSKILRTDLEGSIAIEFEGSGIHFSTTGRG